MHNLVNLTLLLTTKGREEFTIRWMRFMNAANLPVHVIVADGGNSKELEEFLCDKENFPNVNYQYLKFSDVDLKAFYAKCYEASKLVKTKYVKLIDNDDFILPFGVSKDIQFLDENPTYVAAQGLVSGLEVSPSHGAVPLYGKIKKLVALYSRHYLPRSFETEDRSDRVCDMLRQYHPVYYAVYRKEVLLEIFSKVCEFVPQDLIIHETFMAAYSVGLGKVRSANSHISLIRQIGTSSNSNTDIVNRIFKPNFFRDIDNASDLLCTLLQNNGATYRNDLKSEIKSCYEVYFRFLAAECYKKLPVLWRKIGGIKGRLVFSLQRLNLVFFWKRSSMAVGVTSDSVKYQQVEIRKLLDFISAAPKSAEKMENRVAGSQV